MPYCRSNILWLSCRRFERNRNRQFSLIKIGYIVDERPLMTYMYET